MSGLHTRSGAADLTKRMLMDVLLTAIGVALRVGGLTPLVMKVPLDTVEYCLTPLVMRYALMLST